MTLPVGPEEAISDRWLTHLERAGAAFHWSHKPVRVMVDSGLTVPLNRVPADSLKVSVEQDPSSFRGTGGLLSDIAAQYDEQASILMGYGSQLVVSDLAAALARVDERPADVTIFCLENGLPCGLILIRCGVLKGLNPVGYVDLNEQALPEIASRHDVRVIRLPRPLTYPVRTLPSYIHALRQDRRLAAGDDTPWAERWQATFGLIEPGAQVHESVVLHDSVVLAGAQVEQGAVLVRSVVGPGAVVRGGEPVVDRIVSSETRMTED